jgi:hypothetical protein
MTNKELIKELETKLDKISGEMTTLETLYKLRLKLEEICGRWNGDESGLSEDRAHAANEGVNHIVHLIGILEELDIL